jgi:CheY-like chemotaxis protein
MTFSRREACKSQMRTLDLNHVIREAWKMLQHIVSKTVTIRARLEENLDSINGDAGQLEQVLINLAVNSSHAMPNGGSLTVRTALAQLSEEDCRLHPDVKPGNYVVMTVTDTGHGMDKQTQERIYEPFFTTKTVGAGTGLGLSVVFGIVKDHQGHIVCDSEVNVGTTFKIYLPVATQVQKGQPTERSLDHASLAGHERIMVVDDEAPIRKMLERFLTKLGYSVFIAADGPTALQHYAQAEVLPDLIIMDLGMPMMNGWECLEKFRSLDRHVKILIATGYGGDDLEARVLSKGAIGLINKPYNPSGICRKMRDIFDASAAVKAAEGSTPTAGG